MKTFVDVFKKSFLEGTASQLDIYQIIAIMAASLLVAAFVYFVYKKCYCGVVYSHNFNVSVAMMTVISAMIVATISSNVTLSLGMVGALSIIRFRTAIKDPVDLIFLFWAVAAGIAIGARLWLMVLIGNICVGIAFFIMTKIRRKKNVYLLVAVFSDSAKAAVADALAPFKPVMRSQVSKSGVTELTSELHLKDGDVSVTDTVSSLEGVISVSIVTYNGDFAQQ